AELEQWYKERAQSFMAPEYRALTVMLMRPADVAAEVEVTEQMIADAYQQRGDEFHTPERRTVSQVVLPDQASADKAAEMVANGRDLAAIAKELGQQVIDLGAIERADLPEELGQAVFQQAKGSVAAPVRTALGWHVAKVSQVTPERTRPLAEVKGALEADLRRDLATEKLSELASKVEDALGGGASVEETAKRFNLPLVKVPAIDAKGMSPNGKPAADAPRTEAFLDVAFHTDQGTESQLTENENDGYFLLRVDQVTPPQPKPFADIKAQVLAAWQAERRHELAGQRATNIAEQIKKGDSVNKAALNFGLATTTTQPFTRDGVEASKLPPAVTAELFAAQPGGVAVGATQNGWVVARLASVVPFDPAANAAVTAEAGRRVADGISGDLIDQYIAALHADFGVKVDRSQLAREE
ncbi:MAG TPA: peptidyl-prolyl cis-trans isomerase, partial [Candidatus Omnitrophota bacterium]|nr:peptidyl-prolyl cis-trans isomerase [Candidatus Omnitrophota bacterium]